jgi:hypothetical protein
MNTIIKRIVENPIGICLVSIHWIVVFAAYFIFSQSFGNGSTNGDTAFFILIALYILDILAIVPVAILFSPFYFIGETYIVLVAFVSFFTVTFQWLFIGKKIYNFFWRTESDIEKLGIA